MTPSQLQTPLKEVDVGIHCYITKGFTPIQGWFEPVDLFKSWSPLLLLEVTDCAHIMIMRTRLCFTVVSGGGIVAEAITMSQKFSY